MSKASVRASIETVKGDIARKKNDIATIRSRKKETMARCSANIKNASDKSTKDRYRREKASLTAQFESQIRTQQASLSSLPTRLASLRAQLAREKS